MEGYWEEKGKGKGKGEEMEGKLRKGKGRGSCAPPKTEIWLRNSVFKLFSYTCLR